MVLNKQTIIRLIAALLAAATVLTILSSCRPQTKETTVLRIAEQYGLAYAPLQLMRLEKTLEKAGIRTEWVKLMNTAAIREAMLAGRVDIGFMGIPPFLIGRDRGMEWHIFSGLCRAPLGLVSLDDRITSLTDFSASDRIALPQPGSIQHILLSMAAERELGDSAAFDTRLLTLSHPDGMTALASRGDVSAHFTSPPYLFEELKLPGAHTVLGGNEAFGGEFTFIVGVTRDAVQTDEQYRLLELFQLQLEAAIRRARETPGAVAQVLAHEYGLQPEQLEDYLKTTALSFETEVRGLERFGGFMARQGLLKTTPEAAAVLYIRPQDAPR